MIFHHETGETVMQELSSSLSDGLSSSQAVQRKQQYGSNRLR